MINVVKQLFPDEAFIFEWIEHKSAIKLGPFHFPAELAIPVAPKENILVNNNWL